MELLIHKMPQAIIWIYVGVGLVAAITDFRTGKIYNWLTVPAFLLGLALSFLYATAWAGLGGAGVAFLVFFPLHFLKIFGAGDVKLAMAFGAVLGVRGTVELLILSILIAGLGAFFLLIYHRRVKIFFMECFGFFRSIFIPGLVLQWPKLSRDIKAPFGVALFLSFVCVLVKYGK